MQSFVTLVAKGYTSDALSAFDLFEAVTGSADAPPFELDVIVANGPGIAGDVLILYFEDTFAGPFSSLFMSDIAGGFMSAWLGQSFDITQPRYIVECYGPRDHPLEGYWPLINIVKHKRLAPRATTGGVPEDAVHDQPAAVGGAESGSGERDHAEWDVVLKSAGNRRLEVIRLVRDLTGAGLMEAKDMVEGGPALLKAAVTGEEADRITRGFRAVGATIESLPARNWLELDGDEFGPSADTLRSAAGGSSLGGVFQTAPAPPRKGWWQRLFAG
jgi:ribosomal protein L7/L12